jgi:hypothetical protein
MMEYIPGQINESFQKEHFFLVNFNFSWTNCRDKRWGEMSMSTDWDETDTIELSKGDVVVVRFFKSSPISESYSYLEKIIYSDGVETEYKIESIISREFMVRNTMGSDESQLFTHVTKSFERDKKINSIINQIL